MSCFSRLHMPARRRSRRSQFGGGHVDTLIVIGLLIVMMHTFLAVMQATLAQVASRNANRLALQSFQVVYDRRVFPSQLGLAAANQTGRTHNCSSSTSQGAASGDNVTNGLNAACAAARLTGNSVFASGVLGSAASIQYDPQTGVITNSVDKLSGCSTGQQPARITFSADGLVRARVTSQYPFDVGPYQFCLRNEGQIAGRSN